MQLSVWTYEGPPHVGAMRVATAMRGVHFVLHAPQGDTYADLLFTMIERRAERPPVTYTTFQARDLGGDTADLFKRSAVAAYERFEPELMLVGASCTAELIQDDPAGLGAALGLPIPVVPLELSAYQRKENWGAAETFYRVVRACCPLDRPQVERRPGERPRCNLLGPTALGFRHRDDVVEIGRLLDQLGVDVNVTAPLGASPGDLARLGEADFNVNLYPEIAGTAARWLTKTYRQPLVEATPIGVLGTREFVRQVAEVAGVDPRPVLEHEATRLPWYSRSVDSTYLTGKKVFLFGDATHVVAAARVATEELGFQVVGLGTYSREQARAVRAAAGRLGVEALVTEDHLEVEEQIVALEPELVLGTQMERHIAKRVGIPCAQISAPVHVHDYPARYSPQMGFEGSNVLFDGWVHPLMMGLEEHLLGMFREDFEFGEGVRPSHLGPHGRSPRGPSQPRHREAGEGEEPSLEPPPLAPQSAREVGGTSSAEGAPPWTEAAKKELKKIPFFVRGKAKRNTETFARERDCAEITVETLYEAKAHYSAR